MLGDVCSQAFTRCHYQMEFISKQLPDDVYFQALARWSLFPGISQMEFVSRRSTRVVDEGIRSLPFVSFVNMH